MESFPLSIPIPVSPAMNDVDLFYDFDPWMGFICTCCCVPISTPIRSSYHASIRYHEVTIKHLQTGRRSTTDEERVHIVMKFTAHMEGCVTSVISCFPCKVMANERFLSFVGPSELYDYCSSCKVLTTDKDNHNSKKCVSLGYFTEKKYGVKNGYWTKFKRGL